MSSKNNSTKFNTIPQLEVILKSIDLEHASLLKPILDSKEVSNQEKDDIRKYLKILAEISTTPSTLLLQKEIPGRNFEDIEIIELELIPEYILMYLQNKKNLETSKNLIELSAIVRSEGITEDVLADLTDLAKSDTVQHEFKNIKDTIIERYEDKEFSQGIPTGISFVDEITGGIHKGEITSLVAFAGHCKTTLGVNISYNAARTSNNVLYVSFEVSKESVYFDFISRHSNEPKFKMRIPHFGLKKRGLKPEQWEYAKKEIIPDFNNLDGKVYIVDETEFDNYSLFTFEAKFREIEKLTIEETGHGIDVVVIDHVQLLKFGSDKRTTSTGEVINEYISWFRQNAINWLKTGRQVAFICLSQANRSGYEYARENNGKYGATAMAEANELERASTLILTIYAESEMKDLGLAKVQILKYRDSKNEDDPTEVSIDLPYYLFGDNIDGVSEVSPEISSDTINMLNQSDDGSMDFLSEFDDLI